MRAIVMRCLALKRKHKRHWSSGSQPIDKGYHFPQRMTSVFEGLEEDTLYPSDSYLRI